MPSFRLERHHWNAAIYLGVSVLAKGVSLFLMPLYTRRLTQVQYGVYGLFQTLFWLFGPVATLGMAAAFGRFFYDHKEGEEQRRTVGGIVSWMILFCLLGGLACEIVVDFYPRLVPLDVSPRHLHLALWICVAVPIAELAPTYLRMCERAGAFAALSLTQFAVTALTTWFLMTRGNDPLGGQLVGLLVGNLTGAAYAVGFVLAELRPNLHKRLLAAALRYSVPFVPHIIATSLLVGADRWVLEHYDKTADLGLYTLATQLTLPIAMVSSAWQEASSPRLMNAFRDGGYAGARAVLPRIAAGSFLFGGVTLVALVAGLPILRLFIGPRFQAAFPLVPWIGLSLVVGGAYAAFLNVLSLRKTTRIIPLLTLIAFSVNLVLNILLVPRWGVWGSVVGTGLAYACRTALTATMAFREFRRVIPR